MKIFFLFISTTFVFFGCSHNQKVSTQQNYRNPASGFGGQPRMRPSPTSRSASNNQERITAMKCRFWMGDEMKEVNAFADKIDAAFLDGKYVASVIGDGHYYPRGISLRFVRTDDQKSFANAKHLAYINYGSFNICKTSDFDGELHLDDNKIEYSCQIDCAAE
jgi:hypothetical protein